MKEHPIGQIARLPRVMTNGVLSIAPYSCLSLPPIPAPPGGAWKIFWNR